ncbi:hypothetical protein TNCV_3890621 [Trichonephila clavipes]|nr:hypothetical protein TNCV_3890621 [Trichonephila clavipes]
MRVKAYCAHPSIRDNWELRCLIKQMSRSSVPSWHGGTLNSLRATSPLVWLVEGKERWEASSFLPLNRGGIKSNCTVTCMVLKAKANDRRKNSSPYPR